MAVDLMPRNARVVVRERGTLLTSTTSTPVAGVVPNRTSLYLVIPYVVVTTSATAVTLGMSWTDPIAGAAQYGWLNANTLNPGVYPLAPRQALVQAGQVLGVAATAGTANTVTVALAILELA
jgi:hypothetical protein